jgi:putative transposase
MPRRPRHEHAGALHHVVARAASDGRIVVDDSDRLRLLDEFRVVVASHRWECVAYCVMTTHVHLVLHTPEPNLGEGMKLFLGRYAFAFNRRHQRRGHLFDRRYWSRLIDRPGYLCCAAVYTVLNPVVAGACLHPLDFAWSSYRETAGVTTESGLIAPSLLVRTFADEPEQARTNYRELIDGAVARLRARREDERAWDAVALAVAGTRRPAEAGHPSGDGR